MQVPEGTIISSLPSTQLPIISKAAMILVEVSPQSPVRPGSKFLRILKSK